MLSCTWCGTRPVEEFELLDGDVPASRNVLLVERWWHRLGCGRPMVLQRDPTTGDVRPARALSPAARPTRQPAVVAEAAGELRVSGGDGEETTTRAPLLVRAARAAIGLAHGERSADSPRDGDESSEGPLAEGSPSEGRSVDGQSADSGSADGRSVNSRSVNGRSADMSREPDEPAEGQSAEGQRDRPTDVPEHAVELVGEPPVDYEWSVPDAGAPAASTASPFSFNLLGGALGGAGNGASDHDHVQPRGDAGIDTTTAEAAAGGGPVEGAAGSAVGGSVGGAVGGAVGGRRPADEGPVDRFSGGLRRDGAQELHRAPRRPTPGRSPAAGAPREVQLPRRAPVAFGPWLDRMVVGSPAGPDPAGRGEEGRPDDSGHGGALDDSGHGGAADDSGHGGALDDNGHDGGRDAGTRDDDGRDEAAPGEPLVSEATTGDPAFTGALVEALVEAPARPPAPVGRRVGLFAARSDTKDEVPNR